MILCDMDGVLAVGPDGDTAPGEVIYRTFVERPEELQRIRQAGIPLHLVTAKVEAEARQVLRAIDLEGEFASVIGAEKLFWPTVWGAVRNRRLPASLAKSTSRSILEVRPGQRVIMIENDRGNLVEMLDAGALDFGILVPPFRMEEGRVHRTFDLELAFRIARGLAEAEWDATALSARGIRILPWEGGGCLLLLPAVESLGPGCTGPTQASLDTGRILSARGTNVVSVVRSTRRIVRRMLRRASIG